MPRKTKRPADGTAGALQVDDRSGEQVTLKPTGAGEKRKAPRQKANGGRRWEAAKKGSYGQDHSRDGERFDDTRLLYEGWTKTVYSYDLPDGTRLYQQCRYERGDEKRFWPRRLDGDD